MNPEERRYTWRQTQPTVHCRLDFFLTSQSFLGSITSANILPGFKTDHSMITLNISLHSNPRGPGFCTIVATFWENLTEKLKQINLITIDYPKYTAVYLGLKPDTSKFSLQLNFCFLPARYYIWSCRVHQKIPNLTTFLMSLKSHFYIESNNIDATSKKWNPLRPLLNIT